MRSEKKNNIKFIYSYFNQFILIIKNNYLYIIIKKNKINYTSKWLLGLDNDVINIISNDTYNVNIDIDHYNWLFGTECNINTTKQIYYHNKLHNVCDKSVIHKTLQIINSTYKIDDESNKYNESNESNKNKQQANILNEHIIKNIKINILNKFKSNDVFFQSIHSYLDDGYKNII